MKFFCDACHTKYAISDEKVRGKVLKVRCKNCGSIVTVREAVAPVAGRASETDPAITAPNQVWEPAEPAVPTTNWYYALNGQTFGPFTLEGLRRKYASAEIGDATYVWHEKLGPWKPVATEPIFADALAMGHKIVPSRKTLGFTGPVEAIRIVHGGPSPDREGSVPNQAHAAVAKQAAAEPPAKPEAVAAPPARPLPERPQPRPQPVARPEPKEAAAPRLPESPRPLTPRAKPQPVPTPEARPIKDVRKDSLDKLRASLDSSLGPDEGVSLPKPVGGEAIFTFAEGVTPASAESAQDLPAAVADSFDFELPPKHKAAKPSPSSRSDILERVVGPTLEPPASEASEVVDDSGVIPFLPEAPNLSRPSAVLAQDATSESLLVDVGLMNKKGRSRGVVAGVIAAGVILAVVGVGASMLSNEKPPEVVEPKSGQKDRRGDLVIKRYEKSALAKISTMDLEEELLFSEEEAVEPDAGQRDVAPTAAAVAVAEVAAVEPKPKVKLRPKIEKAPVVDAEPAAAVEPPVEETKPEDPLAQLLKQRAGTSPSINAPPDKLMGQIQEGLSKDQARRGFQKVKKSIRDCRERHNRYNAKLEAGKLKISVTVEPSGDVSTFSIEPRSVQNTEFHKCMESHKGRWRFSKFTGKSVVINTSVVIQ